jgi:hypothetical protein
MDAFQLFVICQWQCIGVAAGTDPFSPFSVNINEKETEENANSSVEDTIEDPVISVQTRCDTRGQNDLSSRTSNHYVYGTIQYPYGTLREREWMREFGRVSALAFNFHV